MIRKTLIVIAMMGFLAPVVQAANTYDPDTYPPFAVYSFDVGQSDDQAVKVDGKKTVRWPFEYKPLEICRIPLKMKIGMYIRVKDCDHGDTKIILVQKDCKDLKQKNLTDALEEKNWPCYFGCRKIQILANFDAEISGKVVSTKGVIQDDKVYVTANDKSSDVIVGDGNYHDVNICVTTWEAKIEKGKAGDEEEVGYVSVLARPAV